MPVVVTAKTNRPSAARSRSATDFQRSGDAGAAETKATASASVIMPLLNCPSQWRRDPKVAAKLGLRFRAGDSDAPETDCTHRCYRRRTRLERPCRWYALRRSGEG